MKKVYNTNRKKSFSVVILITTLCGGLLLGGCSESFLEPDPLSFYEPTTTFSTESGLQAALAMCDRHLRSYWTSYENRNISVPIGTEYLFSELSVASKQTMPVCSRCCY